MNIIRKLLVTIVIFFVATISFNALAQSGEWRVTVPVDSVWAGTVQVKWNSATGQSFHSNGWGGSHSDWKNVLTHIEWTPIKPPKGLAQRPKKASRFKVTPHVVFGDDQELSRKRHAIFLIDTYAGHVYVMSCRGDDGGENFPSHDVFTGCAWSEIREADDHPRPARTRVQRYDLEVASSVYHLSGHGKLGPYVTRIDTTNGRVDVAIPSILVDPSSSVVSFQWHKIRD